MEANKDLLKETITDKPCTGWKHTSVCRHGKGIARIDDIADFLQGFEQGLSGNLDFHGGLPPIFRRIHLCRPEKVIEICF